MQSKKKILFVVNSSWYIYNFRISLLKELRDLGYIIKIIAPFDEYTQLLKNENFSFLEWKLSRKSINPFKEIKSIFHLIEIYKKIKPDLVHHFTIKACLYGTIASKISNTKIIFNSITGLGHVFVGKKFSTKILKKALMPLYRLIFNSKRSNIIFQNEEDLNIFKTLKLSNKDSSFLIQGSGVDTQKFMPSQTNRNTKYYDPIRILFPSRLILEKGIIELIEACELLWEDNFNFNLIIAGDTNYSNRSSINQKLFNDIRSNKNINCLGHVKDMKSLYEKVDIIVLPSWREGLSRSLIEAASMQKPIITTNVTGCNQIIDHGINGLLVPLKNSESLMLAIKFLINNPLIARTFGLSARKKIINNFDSKIINLKTINLYKKFI